VTVQVAEVFGGVVLLLMLAVLAVLAIVRPGEDGEVGCFVWVVAFVLFVGATSLFTAAGIK
jgi:hypothetical protein